MTASYPPAVFAIRITCSAGPVHDDELERADPMQVRRGLVNYRGNTISATAVVGVEFSPQDVVKGQV